jgi:hypothetical protein
MIPTIEQIDRMSADEREELLGWLRFERRRAATRKADAEKEERYYRNLTSEQDAAARAAGDLIKAIDQTITIAWPPAPKDG